MKRLIPSFILSFAATVPAFADAIAPVPFRGYPEAYVLHNDRIHVVIVPSISRLAFLAASADAPNLLRFDDALADAGALATAPSTAPTSSTSAATGSGPSANPTGPPSPSKRSTPAGAAITPPPSTLRSRAPK